MAESSRRAARSPRKGGLQNVVFLASAAEALDPVLDGAANLVSILFPWGSLLRGALGLETQVTGAVARLVRPGGRVSMLLSVVPRDGVAGVSCLDEAAVAEVAVRLACHGLRLLDASIATRTEVAATRSSWARRLVAGRDADRGVWRLAFERSRDSR